MVTVFDDIKDIIKAIRTGDEKLKNDFAEKNFPLVWSIVHRFKHHNYDRDDLFQVGALGLIKAINKFDPAYNTQFSTYAVPIIIGEIKRFFRDDGAIKVSRNLKELYIKVQKSRNNLNIALGREPSLNEISEDIGFSVEDIVEAMDTSYYPTSLSEPIYEKDGSTISLEDSLSVDPYEHQLNLITLKDEMEKLEPKERLLIELRYYHDMNQQDVAKRFQVSQVQISRMEKKIIEKLRKQFI